MQVPIHKPPVQSPYVLNTHQRSYQSNAAPQQQPGRLMQSATNQNICNACGSGKLLASTANHQTNL